MVGQTIHYECAQGFRALQRGPAKSICKMICGKVEWTQPQLKCINESQFPGMAAPSWVHNLAFYTWPTRVGFLTHQLSDLGLAT